MQLRCQTESIDEDKWSVDGTAERHLTTFGNLCFFASLLIWFYAEMHSLLCIGIAASCVGF